MVDIIKAPEWDNILKLLMLTMLSDGRIYEREADSFVNESMALRREMPVKGIQTRKMSLEWYIKNRAELIEISSGETFESDLLKLIDNLDILPNKKPLLKSMKNLSKPELGRSNSSEAIITKSRQRWVSSAC